MAASGALLKKERQQPKKLSDSPFILHGHQAKDMVAMLTETKSKSQNEVAAKILKKEFGLELPKGSYFFQVDAAKKYVSFYFHELTRDVRNLRRIINAPAMHCFSWRAEDKASREKKLKLCEDAGLLRGVEDKNGVRGCFAGGSRRPLSDPAIDFVAYLAAENLDVDLNSLEWRHNDEGVKEEEEEDTEEETEKKALSDQLKAAKERIEFLDGKLKKQAEANKALRKKMAELIEEHSGGSSDNGSRSSGTSSSPFASSTASGRSTSSRKTKKQFEDTEHDDVEPEKKKKTSRTEQKQTTSDDGQ